MVEKYLNIDLNDPRASAIAEVMKSKTSKKILDLIAEEEVSETDISEKLDMPLNTVGYNIKKLLKAGLIEKSKNFFWSTRGKKIPTYRSANKKIVISPKKTNYTSLVVTLAAIGMFAVLFMFNSFGADIDDVLISDDNQGSGVLSQFDSVEEFEAFLKEMKVEDTNRYFGGFGESIALSGDTVEAESSGAKQISTDFSSTNIQVEGVDEPDFVKNDGKYIYMISGENLYIVDAFPAEDMRIVSNVTLNGSASNLFVNGDKLVVLMNVYEESEILDKPLVEIAADMIIAPRSYNVPRTKVVVYDIRDKEDPAQEEEYIFDGGYMDARMIGDNVYVVSQKYIGGSIGLPRVTIQGVTSEMDLSDVYYSNEFDESFAFTFVSAIDLENGEHKEAAYLLGTSGTIYVSEDNIYLTSKKYLSYEKRYELRIREGIMPLLPDEYHSAIEEIIADEDLYGYLKEEKAMKIASEYSLTLEGDATIKFVKDLENFLEESEAKISKEFERTVIHKIKINDLNIDYKDSGEVPGHLLNSFSLDEYDGNLRVAVTTRGWRATSLNHLYVLDDKMEIVGSVEDLAQGERIYSVRFMDSRAYMVTFRQVDPLYAIDLSDSKNPEVLGYLKVTGYSSYLHPYDEDHIIGVGMEADEDGRVTGVKIALFDVSDVTDIKERAKYEIESEGDWTWSSSEALYEHKAFLFDREKNLLVVPIQYSFRNVGRYGRWTGAYVFDITERDINLRGKINHLKAYVPIYGDAKLAPIGESRITSDGYVYEKVGEDSWEMKDSPYWGDFYDEEYWKKYTLGDNNINSKEGGINYYDYNANWNRRIQRSLFMDDTLYTVSLEMIKANDLNSLVEIENVEF